MILALIVAFGWYTVHERNVQHDKDIAAQYAANAKEEQRVKGVEDQANSTIRGLQEKLAVAISSPPKPSVVVRMCNQPAPQTSPGSAGPAVTAGNAVSGSGSGVGGNDPQSEGRDIAPGTEAILRRDKVIIDYLQGYVRACQRAGVCHASP